MNASFQPSGYNTASPYLIVDGASRTIEFLVKVFGAVELGRYSYDDGRVRHAGVRIGDTVVMLADAVDGWQARPAYVHVYVPDVDATYTAALAAGATSVQAPAKRDSDEDKRGGVKDPGGTTWWVATRVAHGPDA